MAVAGFGGLRDHGATLTLGTRLPAPLNLLGFRLAYRGRRLSVDIRGEQAAYELLRGAR